MVRSAVLVLSASGLLMSGSGCGTVCNLTAPLVDRTARVEVYGGIKRDAAFFAYMQAHPGPLEPGSSVQPGAQGKDALGYLCFPIVVFVVEPLCSFIGDTATLPITIPLTLVREGKFDEWKHSLNENQGQRRTIPSQPIHTVDEYPDRAESKPPPRPAPRQETERPREAGDENHPGDYPWSDALTLRFDPGPAAKQPTPTGDVQPATPPR